MCTPHCRPPHVDTFRLFPAWDGVKYSGFTLTYESSQPDTSDFAVTLYTRLLLGRDYISVKNAFLTRRLERVSERPFTSAFFL
jgi:hypothetical protein